MAKLQETCRALGRRLERFVGRDNGHEHELHLNGVDAFTFSVKDGGKKVTFSGWNNNHWNYRAGQRVLVRMKDGRTTRYKITRVDHCGDPRNMYFLDAVFHPRKKAPNAKLSRAP